MKFLNTQKRESHDDGILFFYTEHFSHSFEMVFFRRCQERVSASADNMHYVKFDWYIFIFNFLLKILLKN